MGAEDHDTNLLAAYLEGQLSEDERSRVVSHLARCRQCRETLAMYAQGTADGQRAPTVSGRSPIRWKDLRVWLPIAAVIAVSTGAAISVLRLTERADRGAANTQAPVSDTPRETPPPAPVPSPEPREAVPAPDETRADAGLDARRSGERRVGAKTFRLVAGEWVDTQYDPLDLLPMVEAASAGERAALYERVPALRRYAGIGNRVLVVHEGSVYRINSVPR